MEMMKHYNNNIIGPSKRLPRQQLKMKNVRDESQFYDLIKL